MKWEEYYNNCPNWDEKIQYGRLSAIEDFGPDTPSEEVCSCVLIRDYGFEQEAVETLLAASNAPYSAAQLLELLRNMMDDATVRLLIEESCAVPGTWSGAQIIEVYDNGCDDELLKKMLKNSDVRFTEAEITTLCDFGVGEKLIKKICRQSGVPYGTVEDDAQGFSWGTLRDELWEERRTPQKKRDNGRCDGDCAHCPPHYGYRYGRWFYGHLRVVSAAETGATAGIERGQKPAEGRVAACIKKKSGKPLEGFGTAMRAERFQRAVLKKQKTKSVSQKIEKRFLFWKGSFGKVGSMEKLKLPKSNSKAEKVRRARRSAAFSADLVIFGQQAGLNVLLDLPEGFRADDMLDAAGVLTGRFLAHAQRHEIAREQAVALIHPLRHGAAALRQPEIAVSVHVQIAVGAQKVDRAADAGFGKSQLRGHVDGADVLHPLL